MSDDALLSSARMALGKAKGAVVGGVDAARRTPAEAAVLPTGVFHGESPLLKMADDYMAEAERRAGRDGRAVMGACVSCDGLMFFAESAAGVEYVGSIVPGFTACDWHELDPVGWAYRNSGVRWD